jgi:hypothetical protein
VNRGITFDFRPRTIGDRLLLHVCPPFRIHGQLVIGSYKEPGYSGPIVAFMHDYYSVGAEEQRQMALNTVTLCEMLYTTQESNHVL